VVDYFSPPELPPLKIGRIMTRAFANAMSSTPDRHAGRGVALPESGAAGDNVRHLPFPNAPVDFALYPGLPRIHCGVQWPVARNMRDTPRRCNAFQGQRNSTCATPNPRPSSFTPISLETAMKTSLTVIAVALSILSAATAANAGEETYVPPAFSTLTRAEVKADLAAWTAAGLADEGRGDATPDIYSTQYRTESAVYQHKRQAATATAPQR